jgi:hypothetical protein
MTERGVSSDLCFNLTSGLPSKARQIGADSSLPDMVASASYTLT